MSKFALYVVLVALHLPIWFCDGEPQVPCYFIFGASYYDNGNNNRLLSAAKANFLPYGIDYPRGPTGRFTNGRTTADFLAEYLGFENDIPSFASIGIRNSNDILKGVNYASGSSGILEETGKHVGDRTGMDGQLNNHRSIISRIAETLGDKTAAENHLHKCLYSVAMGDNDYINNYFKKLLYDTSSKYSPEKYAHLLLEKYNQQLVSLYNDGARKIVVFGIPPLDCSPAALSEESGKSKSGCVGERTHAINLFNSGLREMVEDINKNLTDSKFVLVDVYGISRSSLSSLKVTDAPCCKVETSIGIKFPMCIPGSIPCANRNDYMWWDQLHQTEAAYKIFADRSYKSQAPTDAFPMDISRLVQNP
ncbi:hypothetical protein JCGZ_22585 [Jatropha curcas]|uniref:Uncharacterized protein n=1 Tax=Jatropha curcas TaxID=180498 RepID=A0A067JYG8_JATCU|nr:GDSL esterase/lipase At1g29670 [Jatropha curcas]KDP25050.1 hypothetical protein JCGZ_22585 [Jatropha curcas]